MNFKRARRLSQSFAVGADGLGRGEVSICTLFERTILTAG